MASFFKPPRFLMRDRGSARCVVPESRSVTCYRCAGTLSVSGYAESASCPSCGGNLRLNPIEISKGHWGSSLMTTEQIHVHTDAQVIANLTIASGDMLIEGAVNSMCISGGTVRLTPTAELKGGVRADKVIIEPGARIIGSVIESPSLALGQVDVDAAIRARPGTGVAAQFELKGLSDHQRSLHESDQEPIPEPIRIHTHQHPRLRVVR